MQAASIVWGQAGIPQIESKPIADDYAVNAPFWQSNIVPATYAVNIADLKPGDKLEVGYPGTPYWIYRRTTEELEFISDNYSGDTPEIVDAII